jgi:hypothetical protein
MSIPFFSRSSTSKKAKAKQSRKSRKHRSTVRRLGFYGAESLERRELMAGEVLTPVAAPTTTVTHPTAIVAKPQDTGLSANYTRVQATAVSETEISVSWSGGGGAQYNYVCMKIGGQWMELGYTNSPSNSFRVTNLRPGTTYEFRLGTNGAFATAGHLAYSGTFTGTTKSSPTGGSTGGTSTATSPVLTYSVNTPSAVNLTWTAVPADKYHVYQWISGRWQDIGTVTGPSATVNRLTPATQYSFCIGVEKGGAIVAYSNAITALTRPASPTDVTATANGTSQITVKWPYVQGAASYTIAYKTPTSGWMYTQIAAPATQVVLNNLIANTNYTIQVGANNAAGSSYSYSVNATTMSAPVTSQVIKPTAAPQNFKVTPYNANYTSYRLSWSPVTNASAYAVYVNTSLGLQLYRTTTDLYMDVTQSPGYSYSFYVVAYNSAGVGPLSQGWTITSR